MLKARSAECRGKTPLNESELYRLKKASWHDDKCLIVTKEQQSVMSKQHFEAVQEIGNNLYGKAK